MKKLLSILLLTLMTYTTAMAQELCDVIEETLRSEQWPYPGSIKSLEGGAGHA